MQYFWNHIQRKREPHHKLGVILNTPFFLKNIKYENKIKLSMLFLWKR